MTDIRIVHEFDCDPDTFWERCFFDEEYNRRLYIERLKFPVWRVTRQQIQEDGLVRTVEIQPRIKDMPAPILKLIGDKFAYVEEGTFEKKAGRYRFRVTPNVLAEKTRVDGEARTEPAGPGKIRRIVDVHFEVKVFGLGGMIEQRSAEDTRRSYDVSAEFTRAFLKEKGLARA